MFNRYKAGRLVSSISAKEKYGLPSPMPFIPDPKKKSHAKKQPEGHIPRARNPFMLFRCNFVDQRLVPVFEETDHRNISRIAGNIWQDMTEEEKLPWVEMAEEEKVEHIRKHGTLRGGVPSSSRAQKGASTVDSAPNFRRKLDVNIDPASRIDPGPEGQTHLSHRRSRSAPSERRDIAQANFEARMVTSDGPFTRIMGDSARRPSNKMFYRSFSGLYFCDGDLVLQIPDSGRRLSEDLGLHLQGQHGVFELDCDHDSNTSNRDSAFVDVSHISSVSAIFEMQPELLAQNLSSPIMHGIDIDEAHIMQSAVAPTSLFFTDPFVGEVGGSVEEEPVSISPHDIHSFKADVDQMSLSLTKALHFRDSQLRRPSNELICEALSGNSSGSSPSQWMDVDVIEPRGLR